ncbi:MAG TPA: CoA ester lyase [Stellaceae bacterium]
MSFTLIDNAPARLNRSELAVPGSQPQFFEKAAKGAADVIFLDLEDAVAPDEKEKARKNVIQALNEVDWGSKTMSLRINGLDTHYMYRDVVDVVEQAGARLDLIMIPKIGTAADVYALDMLVTQIETAKRLKKRVGFELIIETALGMQNLHEIAGASKRLESLHFGVADYAASTRARTTNIGGANPDYAILTDKDEEGRRETHWGDMWHYALARMVVAARANGLRPIDGPFGDFSDADGYKAAARGGAGLRGQMGDPSVAGRARQRGVHAVLQGSGARPPHPRCHGAGQARRARRRGPRRQAPRHRLDPPGRGAGEEGRRDRRRALMLSRACRPCARSASCRQGRS